MLLLMLDSNRCAPCAYFQHWAGLHFSGMILEGDAPGAVMSFARKCDFATLRRLAI